MSQTDTTLQAIAKEMEGLSEPLQEKLLWWLSGAASVLKTEQSKEVPSEKK